MFDKEISLENSCAFIKPTTLRNPVFSIFCKLIFDITIKSSSLVVDFFSLLGISIVLGAAITDSTTRVVIKKLLRAT